MDRQQQDSRDALMRDPYPLYARARAATGLTFVPEFDAWLVARDADVREVLRRPDDFSSAQVLRGDVRPSAEAFAVLGEGFGGRRDAVSADGAEHRRLRAPLIRGLSAARVAQVVPYARERAEELVDSFVGEGRVELMEAYARRLPGDVVGRLAGLDPADVPQVVHGGHQAERLLFPPMDEAGQVATSQDIVTMQQILDGYVCDRRAAPREDLCTELVAALAPGPADEPLTLEQRHELVAQLQNFLIAGHLTTTALIGTTVLHLLRHPDQWERLTAEPARIPAVIEEAARYDAPLQAFRRVTTRDVALAGTELPEGSEVLVAFGAAGRDAALHPSPDVFDIERRQGARHLAFGLGAHACVGAQLAREQLGITLELLTRRLPGLRLADDRPAVTMRPTLIHRAPEALHLTW
ncbi:cytochrome P450 [Streptomyces formicae]|uniref:Putative cytochrome P450 hydroxylase n=1 Tax=Streptomyces formicae TaxID=1616117 RepID=A0A291QI70_9ACTN|nr:putative cytochrome P450 hydroxylase [Streptomyces formicae]